MAASSPARKDEISVDLMDGIRVEPVVERLPSPRRAAVLGAVLALLSGAFCFYGITEQSVSPNSDEVIHIRVVQEMLEHGRWWLPTHGEAPYFNKPPFKLWLSAATVRLLGESNLTYRLLDGICGIATVLAVLLIGMKMYRSAAVGFLSGLQVLACGLLIVGNHGARRGTQDAMLVALCTIAMWYAWRLYEAACTDREGAPAKGELRAASRLGLLTGLAALTKSISGFLPLVVCAVLWPITGLIKPALRRWPVYLAAILISLVLPALYFVPHSLFTPGAFERFFVAELYDRAVIGFHNRHESAYYVRQLFSRGLAGSGWLLGLAAAWALWCALVRRDLRSRFLLAWFLVPVAIYSIAETRLAWYIAPALPAAGMLIAVLMVSAARGATRAWGRGERTSSETGGAASPANRRAFVGRRGVPGAGGAVAGAALVILLLFAAGDLARRLYRVGREVVAMSEATLPVDKLTADLRSKDTAPRVRVAQGTFDTRANPARGRFNVEALYVRMLYASGASTVESDLLAREIGIGSVAAAAAPLGALDKLAVAGGIRAYAVLEPYKLRKHPVALMSFSAPTPHGWTTVPEQSAFGVETFNGVTGFGPIHDAGPIKVRFATSRRSVLLLKGNSLLRQQGSQHALSLGVTGGSRRGELRLQVALNETHLAELHLKPKEIATYTFFVPPGTWEVGDNLLTFLLTKEDGGDVRIHTQPLFYHSLSSSPQFPPQPQ